MNNERIRVTYLIETPLDPREAAEAIAGEQSTGTFIAVPGETEELKERFRARVESVRLLETVQGPSLPTARPPRGATADSPHHRAEVVVTFPLESMGTNLPTLISTIAGNLTELRELSGLRLLDLELPLSFAAAYPGPGYGIEGTRRLAGVHGRPIIGTIIKPSVGLSPEQTADIVRTLADAGADFIKDDELMANPPHSPLAERVRAVMRVVEEAADRHGKKLMYAFNISDEPDAMRRHHDAVVGAGGTCVMASLNSVGFAGLLHLRKTCELPIHGHRNGWGMFTRHPLSGMTFKVYQKLWRLAGVDHLHVNGLQNKFWEPDDSVVESVKSLLTPLFPTPGGERCAMPVVSSGQWGGQAPETYARTGTIDLMYLAGGGMMAHPDGPAAGCAAIRQAWEAAVAGLSVEKYAEEHVELRRSIERFGK